MNDRHDPIRITRRELLKCVLTLPLSVACVGLTPPRAHAQQDGFAPPEWEWLLLWEGRALIGQRASEWRDITGNNANAFATLQHALHYSQLVWMGYTMRGGYLEYRVLARSVGFEGVPLGVGWFQVARGTLTAPAQRWFRVAFDAAHWDEYRVEVRSRSPQVLHSRLLGRRNYMP
ncbi:MAG: hypothetical protein ACK4ME_00585 [Fimbriimonadales bacterium]